VTILHLISTFPPLNETFVLREIRQLHKAGWPVIIGQIRPLHRTEPAKGFEDLTPLVNGAGWFSLEMLKGLCFFSLQKPRQVVECLRIVSRSLDRPKDLTKMLYVLLSSMRLGFSLRDASIKLVRADFLHTEALAARFIKILLGVPYGVTAYTVAVYFKQIIIEDIVKNAAFFVADTDQTKAFLLKMNVPPELVHLIRNGVSLDEFPLRRGLAAASSPTLILGVGSLIPKKGFDVMLRACALLRKRGIQIRCVIIGDGSEREHLASRKKQLGLDDCVEMLGSRSLAELRDWYYRAAIFVMASVLCPTGETDGLPTVIIEAMASGLPIVGTRTAAIPEAVRDGLNGFVVPANEAEPLADCIQVLVEDDELRVRLGVAGRQIAETEFDLKRKAEKLSLLIRQYLRSASLAQTGSSHPELSKISMDA
jgi:glycosyltransferase involved in cell wall biosynthesis